MQAKASQTSRLITTLGFILSVVCYAAALEAGSSVTVDSASEPTVRYQPQSDTLTVSANQHSVLAILNQVSYSSGLEVFAAPSVDTLVSMDFKDFPLEAAIDRITKSLNVVKAYHRMQDGSDVLYRINLLAKGEQALTQVLPIRDLESDAMYYGTLRAKHGEHLEKKQAARVARWQVRLESLPEEVKEKYLKHIEREAQHFAVQKKRNVERAERREQRKEKREQRKLERDAHKKEKSPSATPPELRDAS